MNHKGKHNKSIYEPNTYMKRVIMFNRDVERNRQQLKGLLRKGQE